MDDIKGINSLDGAYNLGTGESVTGYQFGIMTRINVAMVFVQPEVYFNAVGGTVKKEKTIKIPGEEPELLDVTFNRIDIPLLVGIKLGPARINAGPVGTAVISSTNELVRLAEAGEATLSDNFTWGFQAGIGLDLFKKLSLDVRYEGSLSRFGEAFEIDGISYPLDARPTSWILSMGYWF